MVKPLDLYLGLRSLVFKTDPREMGITQTGVVPDVWGVLMESRVYGAVVTLVSLADGSTSLYFSNGGGMIGLGASNDVAIASKAFVTLAESFRDRAAPTVDFPLPEPGRVKFYFLTSSGIYTADRDEVSLFNGQDEFSPLFSAGSKVLTQIRLHRG